MPDKTWRTRALIAVGGIGVSALVLAGCSTPEGGGGSETTAPPSDGASVTVAVVNDLTSFNDDTPTGNVDTNGAVDYLMNETFFYVDPELNVIPNDGFGTMEKISDDPLVVEYTLNEGLTWSDGEPITAADLLLGWASGSGYYDDATLDPETGEVVSGTQYFQVAAGTTGLDLTAYPEISDDNLALTLTYSGPYVDWNLQGLNGRPIHVVADKAGVTVDELVEAFETTPKGDPAAPVEPNETIKAAADFWNTGFDVSSLPDDPAIYVGNGPFTIDSWAPTQSATFVLNENYKGTHNPSYSELVMSFIGDANAQVQALQNGDVDVVSPQADANTLLTLEGLSGIEILQGDDLGYDHLDVRQSGVFADKNVREAFLKTIPRQQILDAIVKPINPEAEVLNSQVYLASQTDLYADTVAQNGSDAYAEVDIAGATELLAGATPTVRIMYNADNPNRVTAFEAIQSSAAQAGFQVVDGGLPGNEWGAALTTDTWDASIFGWGKTSGSPIFLTQLFEIGNGSNFIGFNVPEASELAVAAQSMLDSEELHEAFMELDRLAFENGFGLPLFQNGAIIAHSDRVSGIEFNGLSFGELRNFWEWTVD